MSAPSTAAASTSPGVVAPSHRPSYALSNAQRFSDPRRSRTSSTSDSRFISPGSLIILFVSRDRTPIPIKVVRGGVYHNANGAFPHDSMIGRPFGSRILSTNGRGFIIALRPTPELWTLSLPHRTQILYAPDIAFILLKLGVGPGARVVEAGTGSGSFTHSLARTVARGEQWKGGRGWKGDGKEREGRDARDGGAARGEKRMRLDNQGNAASTSGSVNGQEAADRAEDEEEGEEEDEQTVSKILSSPCDQDVDPRFGRVWSFEFNELRARKARSEFRAHNLSSIVSLRHRNVCKDGFGLSDCVEAVFLDLPSPWEAIPHLPSTLRSDVATKVCCFSPCIEQVLKTATSLRQHGFTDVETFEFLVRTHESLAQDHLAPLGSIEEEMRKLRRNQDLKMRRREKQIENSRRNKPKADEAQANKAAAPAVDGDGAEDGADDEDVGSMDEDEILNGGSGQAHPAASPRDGKASNDISPFPSSTSKAAQDEAKQEREGQGGAELPILLPTGRRSHLARSSSSSSSSATATPTRGEGARGAPTSAKASSREGFKLVSLANIYSRTFPEMRGHTSYLTFATLLPRERKKEEEGEGEEQAGDRLEGDEVGPEEGKGDVGAQMGAKVGA